jgi:hypothetical protein
MPSRRVLERAFRAPCRRSFALAVLAGLSGLAGAAAQPGAPAIPPGTPIGAIHLLNLDVFDLTEPAEDKLLFRLANQLHVQTRPEVLERQLLLQPGDPYSADAVAESERILRANRYLYDASIRPRLTADGTVDLDVTTRDVWTLQGGFAWGRSGGTSAATYKIEDLNFLGLGKEVAALRVGTVDRTSSLLRYRDPSFRGGRAELELSHAANSDGGRDRLRFERPFYSLAARWAAGGEGFSDDRVVPLYRAGKIADRFRARRDFAEVYGGLSPGRGADGTTHVRFGFTYDRSRFGDAAGFAPAAAPPAARTLAYPWIGVESIRDGFVVERDLDRLARSEDMNLGRELSLRLGISSPTFGADRRRLVGQAAASQGFRPAPGTLLLAGLSSATRYGREGAENFLASGRLRLFVRTRENQVFYAALEGSVAHRLDRDQQLLLGGDSGLRGYPLRYQNGDRRLLLTLEQRVFTGWELFHLAHVGGAIFFDAGEAWFAGSGQRRLLRDVGAGLRLGSSRSSRGSVVHLDVAFPLDRDRSIASLQWLVLTKETF